MCCFLAKGLLSLITICLCNSSYAGVPLTQIQKKLEELEKASKGRVGVFALDTGNNITIEYRAEERFPFCSSFKAMVGAAILKKSMVHGSLLKQRVHYTKEDVTQGGYSPITEKHVAEGMTVAELCAATIQYSDNTATNLLMKQLGGIQAITSFARSIGDKVFRLDRWEPELNSAVPDDLRDTTSPHATGRDLQNLIFSNVLAKTQREQLELWLKGNTTGDDRIRAGVPKGWTVGDKTGTCSFGTTNDIGIVWPPTGSPIIIVIYFTQNKKDAPPRNDVIVSVARILVSSLASK